jgi:hypothetical protein
MMGRHSLELYLLQVKLRKSGYSLCFHLGYSPCVPSFRRMQFSLWLGAFAKGNVVPVPELRVTSSALQSLLFCAAAVIVRYGTATLLSFSSSRKTVSGIGALLCFTAFVAAPYLGPAKPGP